MKHKLYNKLGQEVGEYDGSSRVYFTTRDLRKGEIFVRKHWFGGKYIDSPIAIDTFILEKLLQGGCRRVDILISGLKEHSFIVSYAPKWIKENSKSINFDRYNKQGKNITHFGNQLVFDIKEGLVGGPSQKTLD